MTEKTAIVLLECAEALVK